MWGRLIFPDGSSLVLDNLKGTDQSSYSGFKGAVNRHWGSIISSALFVSLLGAGVEIIAPTDNNNRDNNDPRTILAENTASAVAEAIAQMLYRDFKGDTTREWRRFQRSWARPAAIYSPNWHHPLLSN